MQFDIYFECISNVKDCNTDWNCSRYLSTAMQKPLDVGSNENSGSLATKLEEEDESFLEQAPVGDPAVHDGLAWSESTDLSAVLTFPDPIQD